LFSSDPGSEIQDERKSGSGIPDKHPDSTTLVGSVESVVHPDWIPIQEGKKRLTKIEGGKIDKVLL
jgi:hypothetical protein